MIISYSCKDEDEAPQMRSRHQSESAFRTWCDHMVSVEPEEAVCLVTRSHLSRRPSGRDDEKDSGAGV